MALSWMHEKGSIDYMVWSCACSQVTCFLAIQFSMCVVIFPHIHKGAISDILLAETYFP